MRHDAGLSLSDVFAMTGVHISQLSEIESGKVAPGLLVFRRLSKAYGIPVWQIVAMTEAERDAAP